jgi:hypothetical protein
MLADHVSVAQDLVCDGRHAGTGLNCEGRRLFAICGRERRQHDGAKTRDGEKPLPLHR